MIPRLSSEALPTAVAEMLRPRVERLGYLGEFFKCAAHQPAALLSFMAFTENLRRALPDHITEVVALTVSTELRNAYERHQHERLCLKLGFGEEWIRAIEATEATEATKATKATDATEAIDAIDPGCRAESRDVLSEPERRVQTLTLAVIRRHGRGTARELDDVVSAIGHEGAIAVLMLIGRYVTHALMVNSLDLEPPVPSPLAPGD